MKQGDIIFYGLAGIAIGWVGHRYAVRQRLRNYPTSSSGAGAPAANYDLSFDWGTPDGTGSSKTIVSAGLDQVFPWYL